ncbi:MAG TPA: helix-turn-helix domain-containing protein, partial [Sphingomicrobium sp.]|nr:helix-turn-helix domain-containing protein [Sphingomicrobium sp.]
MVDRLIEKTGPAVQLESNARTKGERTRERIMDLAYQSIVEKGFAATSIEELVEAAGITKSGFFYHFRDKNDLARQLFERFLAEDDSIMETLERRARELSDDPLQSFLIFLNVYAQMMDDMNALHPGCMVATVTYQERMFDAEVRQMNVDYLRKMRAR